MKYDLIKKYGLSHEFIAKKLGYKTKKAFQTSSSHKRIMNGLNDILMHVEAKHLVNTDNGKQ